uniref:Reverse transcriptase-like protein n=1 Tax=Tetrahymena thermophila TaxID=5911 RepID=Q94825_TETTH|nr:reverse transcriptase-like protein [Tetrahymena thermophila]
MQYLQKQSDPFTKPQFYFDGARILDGLALFYHKKINIDENFKDSLELIYNTNDEKLKDIKNIQIFKEEIGTDFIEKQMFRQFTDNNIVGENEIKNIFQKNLYTDIQKQNNLLASIFLYFIHKFYYDDENSDDINNIKNFKNSKDMIQIYKNMKTNGLPYTKFINKIKSVYTDIHNLLVEILQLKYGQQANIAFYGY